MYTYHSSLCFTNWKAVVANVRSAATQCCDHAFFFFEIDHALNWEGLVAVWIVKAKDASYP
jgi:hypothetical protein